MDGQQLGLKRPPFGSTETFPGPQQLAVVGGLKRALVAPDSVIVVSGPAGVGKTVSVQHALERIDGQTSVASVGRNFVRREDLLELLLDRLGVDQKPASTSRRVDALHQIFHSATRSGLHLFILVEDAERLGEDALAELESLTAADGGSTPGAHLILQGYEGVEALLASPKLARLRQRMRRQMTLTPFSSSETRAYIEHAIRGAGGEPAALFDDDACEVIHEVSGGIARIINNVGEALVHAAAEAGAERITGELARKVAAEDFGLAPTSVDAAPTEPTPGEVAASDPEIPDLIGDTGTVPAPPLRNYSKESDAADTQTMKALNDALRPDTALLRSLDPLGETRTDNIPVLDGAAPTPAPAARPQESAASSTQSLTKPPVTAEPAVDNSTPEATAKAHLAPAASRLAPTQADNKAAAPVPAPPERPPAVPPSPPASPKPIAPAAQKPAAESAASIPVVTPTRPAAPATNESRPVPTASTGNSTPDVPLTRQSTPALPSAGAAPKPCFEPQSGTATSRPTTESKIASQPTQSPPAAPAPVESSVQDLAVKTSTNEPPAELAVDAPIESPIESAIEAPIESTAESPIEPTVEPKIDPTIQPPSPTEQTVDLAESATTNVPVSTDELSLEQTLNEAVAASPEKPNTEWQQPKSGQSAQPTSQQPPPPRPDAQADAKPKDDNVFDAAITLDDSLQQHQEQAQARVAEEQALIEAAKQQSQTEEKKNAASKVDTERMAQLSEHIREAKSLEDIMDETAAETLFGEEITAISAAITESNGAEPDGAPEADASNEPADATPNGNSAAMGATEASAKIGDSAELTLEPDPAPQPEPVAAAQSTPAQAPPATPSNGSMAPAAATAAKPSDAPATNGGANAAPLPNSAAERLRMVRELNLKAGKAPPPIPDQVGEAIVLGETAAVATPDLPAQETTQAAAKRESVVPIEDQFGESMTAKLKALSADAMPGASQDDEEAPRKKGLLSRFRRS